MTFAHHTAQAREWTAKLRHTLRTPAHVGVAYWQSVWAWEEMTIAGEMARDPSEFDVVRSIRGDLEPLCRECARQIDDAAAYLAGAVMNGRVG